MTPMQQLRERIAKKQNEFDEIENRLNSGIPNLAIGIYESILTIIDSEMIPMEKEVIKNAWIKGNITIYSLGSTGLYLAEIYYNDNFKTDNK